MSDDDRPIGQKPTELDTDAEETFCWTREHAPVHLEDEPCRSCHPKTGENWADERNWMLKEWNDGR